MRLLRHQPLLVWTLVLLFLIGLLLTGLTRGPGGTEPLPARPIAATGYSAAEDLLGRLPGAYGALASGSWQTWLEEFAVTARLEAGEHRSEDDAAWSAVLGAVAGIEEVDPEDRSTLLGALEVLNGAVMNLLRSYR